MKNRSTLILTRRQIERLIDMTKAIEITEEVFKAHGQGKTQMPAKIYIHLDRYNGDFRAMPAYAAGIDACGIKWVNVHPDNKRHGLPAVMALIILSDPRTGLPLAIMDGTRITNLRTGAAGGVAAKYLANPNSSRIALIGCGEQAKTQLEALNVLFKIRGVFAHDRRRSCAIAFIKAMRHLGIEMRSCPTIEECVRDADIIITTTPSRRPIVKSRWIKRGAHINAIGADAKGKEELEPALLKRARIFVDDRRQAMYSGEINVPLARRLIDASDIKGTLGEVIIKKRRGRKSRDDITLFDSTGLAIQDVAMASYIYKKALSKPSRRKAVSFL